MNEFEQLKARIERLETRAHQVTFLDPISQNIIKDFVRNNVTTEAFPVGSVFISTVSTNPATLLGYGTWSAFGAGKVLVGLDSGDTDFDTLEETGGAKTHTLTTNEIPSHSHSTTGVNRPDASQGSNQVGFGPSTTQGFLTTGLTGGGAGHNNLQPYIVVQMWKRTA